MSIDLSSAFACNPFGFRNELASHRKDGNQWLMTEELHGQLSIGNPHDPQLTLTMPF